MHFQYDAWIMDFMTLEMLQSIVGQEKLNELSFEGDAKKLHSTKEFYLEQKKPSSETPQ